jgi:hypothetical protein
MLGCKPFHISSVVDLAVRINRRALIGDSDLLTAEDTLLIL